MHEAWGKGTGRDWPSLVVAVLPPSRHLRRAVFFESTTQRPSRRRLRKQTARVGEALLRLCRHFTALRLPWGRGGGGVALKGVVSSGLGLSGGGTRRVAAWGA